MRAWQSGDDMALFVIAANDSGVHATEATVRATAYAVRNGIRRQIRTRFSTAGRIWNARGFAAAVVVKKLGPGHWAVADKATYSHKRSTKIGLLFVFNDSPTIRGQKGWVAVPIRGAAPIHANGRRYMWPSEAVAAGWQIEIVPVMGKPLKIIFARRGGRGPWVACWFYIPPYRMKKRLDVEGEDARQRTRMEGRWLDEFDKDFGKRRAGRRAA